MDAFEDLADPPASVVAVAQNRFLSSRMIESTLYAVVWSVLKAKRARLKYADGFIARFYDISEHVSPIMAFGFLGSNQDLKDLCNYFKSQICNFLIDLFNAERVRFTCVEDLADDIWQICRARAQITRVVVCLDLLSKMADTNPDLEFIAELKQCDDFYCSLVDLIPPDNFGFDEDVKEQLKNYKHKSIEAKLKEYEKDRLSAAGRQVIGRLDYAQPKTVTDIWKFLDNQRPGVSTSKRGHFKNKPMKRKLADKNGANDSKSQDEISFNLADKQQAKRNSKKSKQSETEANREQLVAKLQAKLEKLRKSRESNKEGEAIKKKREKNLQRKMKRVQLNSGNKVNGLISKDALSNGAPNSNAKGKKVDDGSQKKVIKNSEGQIVYSKFDFAVTGLRKEDLKNKETEKSENRGALKRKREFAGKDYKKLLEKVEQKEQKLADLKEKDPEKAAQIENNQKWEKALEKVEGIKVKDDKKMLKMNIKRKEKQKSKTKHEWTKRDDNVKAKMAKRQDKRRENLKARSDQKKARKIEKAKKKGRIAIP
uniref:Ribosomal RNA-processing protein 14/surfeit locus protein 6 C-terminal domain-containing protein n=1 Tax=Romanomermis culicivorax TaxID=13658 RepID=A0A915IU26_ROMCU